ncbi:MAG: VWA domain-containing protein [Planctomycetes bacterium]|nr:VWA domain-containing protein [Planctomycetota bacterium]
MTPSTRFAVPFLAVTALLAAPATAKEPVYPLEIRELAVRAQIDGNVARTTVRVVLANTGGRAEELDLLFPLPPGAAITSSRLLVEGAEVEGRLLARPEAKEAYEEVVRRQRDPSILKHAGSSAYRSRVFPVPAGGERVASLEYVMALPFEGDSYEYRFVPWDARLFRGNVGRLSIEVEVVSDRELAAIYSPTHPVEVVRDGTRRAVVSYEEDGVRPDGDFRLLVTMPGKQRGMDLLTYRRPGEDGYFMMLGTPPAPEEGELPERNVLLVVDRSGSMRGTKWEEARAAFEHCLTRLRREDRFNVIFFGTEVESYEDRLVPAEPERVSRAVEFVRSLEALGGTNLDGALRTALAQADESDRETEVVLLSDGDPTIGERDFTKILAHVETANTMRARFFVFGVGDDVHIPFLDRLAVTQHGFPMFLSRGENLEEKVTRFYDKIAHPVILDARLDFEGIRVHGVYPPELGSLYAGSEFMVLGRYSGSGTGRAALSGTWGRWMKRGYTYTGEFPERSDSADFLPRLWAARRIGYLIDELRLHGKSQEVLDEVVRLSRDFGILTEYTAFLVEEPDLSVEGLSRRAGEEFERAGTELRGEAARRQAMSKEALKLARELPSPEETLAERTRRIVHEAGTTFVERDGVWTDVSIADLPRDAEVERVERLGDRWFELARADDRLARAFSLGDRVRVRDGAKILEVK